MLCDDPALIDWYPRYFIAAKMSSGGESAKTNSTKTPAVTGRITTWVDSALDGICRFRLGIRRSSRSATPLRSWNRARLAIRQKTSEEIWNVTFMYPQLPVVSRRYFATLINSLFYWLDFVLKKSGPCGVLFLKQIKNIIYLSREHSWLEIQPSSSKEPEVARSLHVASETRMSHLEARRGTERCCGFDTRSPLATFCCRRVFIAHIFVHLFKLSHERLEEANRTRPEARESRLTMTFLPG
jgi:hypothetical protein